MNALDILVHLIELNSRDESIDTVLDAIDDAIVAAGKRIEDAGKTNDDEWAQVVVDSECEAVESLLGTAFIVCQTRITAIVSATLSAYDQLTPAQQAKLTFTKVKSDVLNVGTLIPGTNLSEVTVMNAVANYFKHRDEWDDAVSWSKLKGLSLKTAQIIAAVGLEPLTTGNLRRGAKVMGWDSNVRRSVHGLTKAIARWATSLLTELKSE